MKKNTKIGAYTATEIVARFLTDDPLCLRETLAMTVSCGRSYYDAMGNYIHNNPV